MFLTGIAEAHLRHARLLRRAGEHTGACRSLQRAREAFDELAREGREQPIDRDRRAEAQRLSAGCARD